MRTLKNKSMRKDHTHLKKFVRKKLGNYFSIGYLIGAAATFIITYLIFIK